MVMKIEEIEKISESFESKEPQEVLRWAIDYFKPKIALACSFGLEDVVIVDMISKIDPDTRIFYIDTDLLFKETYDVIERIKKRYGIKPVSYKSEMSLEEQEKIYGKNLWGRDPNLCCGIRKVEPLKEALSGLDAWITGIRREQSETRKNVRVVEWDELHGLVKINPLVNWTLGDTFRYVLQNDVPYNILHDKNYPSVGCYPCTRPVMPGEDQRSGRWSGFGKTECGLHVKTDHQEKI
ncbi:MAG: phosphoadenylyl-sulfate reductase [Candidatus Methanolliviera hydrocarbonicum]|uniref:Adenosine 5'-phosphosulfate reductase n=1 Tax=Candidatus Methanolliviera hydrocarbonicum TaxID=2491085 RepID=A0A520KWW3_9EURY|nr:MAG: phosphoadenylyl-sulfate reductase [Candidatus Methanolliviera hydrocarbonicum]